MMKLKDFVILLVVFAAFVFTGAILYLFYLFQVDGQIISLSRLHQGRDVIPGKTGHGYRRLIH